MTIASALGVVTLAGSVSAAPTRVGTERFALTASITEEGGTVVASGFFNETGQFDDKKCTFSFTEQGVYVFGDGTGAWEGYTGSGTLTVTGSGTYACEGPPVGTFTIDAKGPINPPSTDD